MGMRKYDDKFKQQILKKVFDGQSVSSVSRELSVNESLIHKWKRDALENGRHGRTGEEEKEILALKKRLRELEQENEILKKAALIFGRGS
ncbi:MAG: transposase [Acidobacteriota bacterium]|nr:transposase [Acidobacteriota bacterium]